MAAYIIYYNGGRKMMRAINSKEEYLALRQTPEQQRITEAARRGETFLNGKGEPVSMKVKLQQFCYSCMPNDDGSLARSTRLANSVAMDIDYPGTDCGKTLEEWKQETLQKVLDRQEAAGGLMLGDSATKGFHFVFLRHPEMSQVDNLRWASKVLDVPFDPAAKDHTRVMFEPSGEIYFVKEELTSPQPSPKGREPINTPCDGGLSTKGNTSNNSSSSDKSISNTSLPLGEGRGEVVSSSLAAFDLCVTQAGLSADKMDIWGQHNWHSNLMAVLSVGLPKLMSKEQLLAVVDTRLPNYSKTTDCIQLIDYFYDKYTADKGYMSTALRDINVKAQMAANEADDEALKELTAGWQPPRLPKKLPRLMNLLAGNYDPRFREMLLLSALPILSAHASHFRAQYQQGKIIGPQQIVAVIGSSGSGKGNCTELFREMVQYTLQANDEREWEKVKENAELRDKKANAKERPPKYHPRLRLFETTSKSSILELQSNLGKNGMLLGQFSEVDGLSGATRTAYSDISVLLRKGWDLDMHRQFYMSDATCNTYTQMSISLLMAGTVRAMLERMYSDSNCEGGLMQRSIPVLVPKTKRTFRPPRQNFLTDDEKKERDGLLISLYQKDLSLGDDVEVLDAPLTNKAIGEWFDSLEELYNDGQLTEAEADLSHRCGEFMLRAAIPLIALYGGETKEIVEFARWVGEMAFYNICRIFGHRVQRDLATANELLSNRSDGRKTAEPLLAKMPEVFTQKEFSEMRVKEGQSPEVKMLLSRYCKKGKLIRLGKGVYQKVHPTSDTTQPKQQ